MESRKRENWESDETRYFLQLMRERQIMKSLDGKRFRADEIFKHLESPMNEKGYKKTSKQMQTRFRILRLQYNKIRREMGKSGCGNLMSSFPYAEEMDDLLSFRPIALGDVVDSTPENNENSCSTNNFEEKPDCGLMTADDAVPASSSSSQPNSGNASARDSTSHVRKKRKISRTHEAITLRYAEKVKEIYEEVQNKIMIENRNFIKEMMESEKKIEEQMMKNMFENQWSVLKKTTNQLLSGLQNIFTPNIIPHQSTVQGISPIQYSPFAYNSNSQPCTPSSRFPRVVLNLKNPVKQTVIMKKYSETQNEKPNAIEAELNLTEGCSVQSQVVEDSHQS